MLDDDLDAMPPLSKAICEGDTKTVKSLIQNGSDVNIQDDDNCTPLHYAVFYNSYESLNRLLSQPSIQVDLKNRSGETPLLMSIKSHCKLPYIQALINSGADLNTETDAREVALQLAIDLNHNDIAAEMLKHGADVDRNHGTNQTALHLAVNQNNIEGLCLLLYYGADVTWTDYANMTPLMYAISDDNDELAEILLDYYDDFTTVVSIFGETAFDLAVKADKEYAKGMLKSGVFSVTGRTLKYSLQYKNCDIFDEILFKFNFNSLVGLEKPFLCVYVQESDFKADDFTRYLFKLLDCTVTDELVDELCLYEQRFMFWGRLFHVLAKKNVDSNERIKIIYLLLSLSFPVSYDDLILAHIFYGSGDEAKILTGACGAPQQFLNALL